MEETHASPSKAAQPSFHLQRPVCLQHGQQTEARNPWTFTELRPLWDQRRDGTAHMPGAQPGIDKNSKGEKEGLWFTQKSSSLACSAALEQAMGWPWAVGRNERTQNIIWGIF